MRWTSRGRSSDMEDMRGRGGGFGGFGGLGGGGGMPIPFGCAGRSMGGMVFMLILLFIGNSMLGGGGGGGGGGVGRLGGEDKKLEDFVSYVFDDAQQFWTAEFEADGRRYDKAKIVLFDGPIPSGCGQASPEIGPHYCPADSKVYLDLAFFDELAQRFEAPGDFAQAYVIAHEVGHHVQNLLGTSSDVRALQEREPENANEYSVRLELQADCYAGAWAHSVYEEGALEPGDINEGLKAASSVGDDRLQRQAGAEVNAESWTHGSSEQRAHWFRTGYESGDYEQCDTFSGGI